MTEEELPSNVNAAMYQRLVDVAQQGDVIPYGALGEEFHLHPRTQIPREIEQISRYENDRGRPLLSAIVVNHETMLPGHGFYELGVGLGLVPAGLNEDGQLAFAVDQMNAVHKTWAQ